MTEHIKDIKKVITLIKQYLIKIFPNFVVGLAVTILHANILEVKIWVPTKSGNLFL